MTLDLRILFRSIADLPDFKSIIAGKDGEETTVSILDAAKPYLIGAIYHSRHSPVLIVTAQPENAKKIAEQLAIWTKVPVTFFPEPDALPYERLAGDVTTELERVQALALLTQCRQETLEEMPLMVTSAAGLMSKVTSYADFAAGCHVVREGMEIDPLKLLRRWEAIGYTMESLVEMPGTMGRRGGIIDIYPPTSDFPARLEFFGNTVDSIRLFDPSSQRSLRAIPALSISPATELLKPLAAGNEELRQILSRLDLSRCSDEAKAQFQQDIALMLNRQKPRERLFYAPLFNSDSILSYLPADSLLVLDQPGEIEQEMEKLEAEAQELYSESLARGELPDNFPKPYLTWSELEPLWQERRRLLLTAWGGGDGSISLPFSTAPSFGGQLPSFLKKAEQLMELKNRVIIVSHQASRLSELFAGEDVFTVPVSELKAEPQPGSLTLVQGILAEGWVLNHDTYLFTDAEIFGFVKQRRLAKKRPVPHHILLFDIKPGDYVVHVEHGVARFAGVTTLSADGVQKEYLVLQYAAGDKLYVPTDQIDRVSRYIGAGDRPPVLSRLGTQEWSRTKRKAKEAAEELAQELLALYATREVVPGFAFSKDTLWQQELEASFPYVETPDQLEAVKSVKLDMEKPRPMDRLVCGDVGYGKTEVALRAAFKAVMDGKQVAMLVPTTVLAEQHYATFSERLKAFPVRVESLSRFRSPREQKNVLEGLVNGTVDIVIGTHRLLQKDVIFKDLGLLIIDEEQRFGVLHKEHLKKLRREVDVLTLSATPIPRTLHMALVGVRDMSTMETPPDERLPVKTYVAEYDDRLVREAILRELERNGQVFFVHNRVQSIALIASRLRSLVPEAKIDIAHGQMPEEKLEAVMTGFAQGKSDVLVCSTIIESGLDMPRVNTLIVNQADKLGLTQLYQLRGRVGRGENLAYAYFLYDKGKHITHTAQKRLRTIYEATELGAGFTIAMKDLEIRGAGTLLGTKQSGYISAIGFNLYCRLLAEAVEEQKEKMRGIQEPKPPKFPAPTIDLPLTAFIPEDYVADVETRLSLYQKMVKLDDVEQIEMLRQEMTDRFGTPPEEVSNLLYVVRIKLLAKKARLESISVEEGQIVLRRFEGMTFDRKKLEPFMQDGVKVGISQIRLNPARLHNWKVVLEGVVGMVLT